MTSPANILHPRQRSVSTITHRRQLDRPVHYRLWYPQRDIAASGPERGIQSVEARRQDRCAGVWQGVQPRTERVCPFAETYSLVYGIADSLRVYKQYSFQFIPIMGKILAGDSESYQYLVESIEKFPTQAEFAKL